MGGLQDCHQYRITDLCKASRFSKLSGRYLCWEIPGNSIETTPKEYQGRSEPRQSQMDLEIPLI